MAETPDLDALTDERLERLFQLGAPFLGDKTVGLSARELRALTGEVQRNRRTPSPEQARTARVEEALRWFLNDIDGQCTNMGEFDAAVARARAALAAGQPPGAASMTERERNELIAAIALVIMARGGSPFRTQGKFVLEIIEEQGWTLTRKDAP